ncbi:hypothetical protein BJX70DRAFT_409275 [Aspergillus crustosus]
MHIPPPPTERNQPLRGLLHQYTPRLAAFEYSTSPDIKPHTLLFVGGLNDGLGTVSYLTDLISALEESDWSVFAPVLSSSSTGGQDVLQYISSCNPRNSHSHPQDHNETPMPTLRPKVDGAIMQAPVSDRQAIQWVLREGTKRHTAAELQRIYNHGIEFAQKHLFEDHTSLDTIVLLSVTTALGYPASTAISSRRFLSLSSPDSPRSPSDEDLFSSDLSDERLKKTFGIISHRGVLKDKLLVLYSGSDPYVPPEVDKGALMERWRRSGIIPGPTHTLEGRGQEGQRMVLVQKVARFLNDIENGP